MLPDARHEERSRGGASSLADDTRGAILIVGIMMATLLVGAMWYIAALGDASIFRERLMDAADSAAFENAVWHARGMNILAVLNIVMAFIMSFLVIWRMVQVFLITVGAIILTACALSLIPFLAPFTAGICAWGSDLGPTIANTLTRMGQFEERTKFPEKIVKTCIKIHQVQEIVATAIPIVGTTEAILLTQGRFQGEITGAAAFSTSLIPTKLDNGLKSGLKAIGGKGGKWTEGFNPRFGGGESGWGPSLPVQKDNDYKLCEKAGGMIGWTISALIDRAFGCGSSHNPLCGLADATSAIAGVFSTIAGAAPAVFCNDGFSSMPKSADDALKKSATEGCDGVKKRGPKDKNLSKEDKKKWFTELLECNDGASSSCECTREDKRGCCSGHGGVKGCGDDFKFDDKACYDDTLKKTKAKSLSKVNMDELRVAKVFVYAGNGNVFFQVWGFSTRAPHAPPRLSADNHGIEVAAAQSAKRSSVVPAEYGLFTPVQAEFFSDCAGAWGECVSDALWQMRWRARLRRLHDPVEMLEQAAAQAVFQTFWNWADKQMGRFLGKVGGGRVPKLVGRFCNWSGQGADGVGVTDCLATGKAAAESLWSTSWSSKLRNKAIEESMSVYESAGRWTASTSGKRSDTIH